ncbi:energy-coupling factor transporter transmembrane component T [Bacillus sp. B15-48]|uniref:energy-coupling factor transporter transmembrane component T n=1 Tax=Bacillus sp. B15-48 TaxID=1548601 RepID=UPI00193F24A9|nr:energy-coupling factor transporter transmembrane component T [Bacillus sp. B15-48]MBM4763039.1 energy-coupling factor transporter transmembrane protein EcfT [Bacillus sp. B15-48]
MSADNIILTKTNTPKIDKSMNIDGLIKFIIATMLAIMSFLLEKQISLVILSIYLLIATLATRIKFRTLLVSTASYFIIVLIPYLFGYLMSELLYLITNNQLFSYNKESYEVFLRMFSLFVIWYVSILYFHTTPMKTVIGLLDKLLFPLKLIGVPVKDYLKIVMFIVQDLKGKGLEIKDRFLDNARSSIGGNKIKLKTKIKGISHIIVSFLVNSFERINEIQSSIENMNHEELYNYKFKISISDIVVVFSFILLTLVLLLVEKGYLF